MGTPYRVRRQQARLERWRGLHFEAYPHLRVRVALIEPGSFPTWLGNNTIVAAGHGTRLRRVRALAAVGGRAEGLVASAPGDGDAATPDAQLVADTIVAAATTDISPRLRWPVGTDAELVIAAKDSMSFEDFEAAMRDLLDWRE